MTDLFMNTDPSTFRFEETDNGWQALTETWKQWDQARTFETREAAVEAATDFLATSVEANALSFWWRAKCTHTYRAQGKRTNDHQIRDEEWDLGIQTGLKVVKVRRYRDPKTGEVRRTVELEIQGGEE